MVVEACLVLATCCAYIGLTAWGGFTVRELAANPILGILQHCLFYWMFAAFGTPIVCLIAYRTWRTYCEEKQISKRLSSSGGTDGSYGRKPVVYALLVVAISAPNSSNNVFLAAFLPRSRSRSPTLTTAGARPIPSTPRSPTAAEISKRLDASQQQEGTNKMFRQTVPGFRDFFYVHGLCKGASDCVE